MRHLRKWQRIVYTIVVAMIAIGMIGITFLY